MKILALDIGTGTQDIILFDSTQTIENCVKMVMPSATAIIARRIEEALAKNKPLLLTGVTMGGGPSGWALEKYLKSNTTVYATPDAARTFNDDLTIVEQMGVKVISEDEAKKLNDVEQIQLRDLDLEAVRRALEAFGVDTNFDGVAVAVLDHGAAPPDVSDRVFRFDHLRRTVEARNELEAFAYLPHEIPDYLTRMKAVVESLDMDVSLLLMDTGPAAALGSLEDRRVSQHRQRLILNLGNMHSLAFHLEGKTILGLFEHHTGMLDTAQLDSMVEGLIRGTLTNEEVFKGGGHGCYYVKSSVNKPFLAVTGPRRRLMAKSRLKPYFVAPHGDMMLTGCFGLIRGFAAKMPQWREEIWRALEN